MQVLTYASLGIFIQKNSKDNIIYSTNHFKSNTQNDFYEWLDQLKVRNYEKIIFSPDIEKDLNNENAVYKAHNLFSIQDVFFKKIRIINDSFLKGISYDKFLNDRSEKHGNLDFNEQIFSNKINLDIIGADVFIIKKSELDNYQFIKNLEYVSSIKINKIEILSSDNNLIQEDQESNIYNQFDKFFNKKTNIIIEEWQAFRNYESFGDLFAINYPYFEKEKYFLFNEKCFSISFFCQNNSNLLRNKIKFDYLLEGKDGDYKVKFSPLNHEIIIVLIKCIERNGKLSLPI